MSLNCKPGDLARVVSDRETIASGMADKIITVTQLTMINGVWPGWLYAGPAHVCICGCGCEVDGIADALLRPIRGQDGDDETLAWAGKPERVSMPEVIPA